MFPIKYIENNLVFNHDGECFAYYELIPYNYSFLSPEEKYLVHDNFHQLIVQNRDGKIYALQISTESSLRAIQERSKKEITGGLREIACAKVDEQTNENDFTVTYSVDQTVTEGEKSTQYTSAYTVVVYVDDNGDMVITQNPTISSIPIKSSYEPTMKQSDGTVDAATISEVNEFLETFFKLYPTATEKELAYYVSGNVLEPVNREYTFSELVNPVFTSDGEQVKVSVAVKYLDQRTKATQISQFDLVLKKTGGNWKVVG